MIYPAEVATQTTRPIFPPVNSNEDKAPPQSRAPRGGLQMMALILFALAALAVYSNVQKTRRDQIETVTIAPVVGGTPSPSPAAR